MMIQHAEIPGVDPSITIEVALNHDDFVRWCSVNQPDPYSPEELMHKLHYQTVSAPGVNGYMAIVDDRPVARCVSYISHGLGRVESVFVEESYRRRGIAHALVGLERLHIERAAKDQESLALIALGRATDLSAYDSTYLLLALHSGLPLATLDRRLADAAVREGVTLVA